MQHRTVDDMVSNPQRFFHHPADVLSATLSTNDKRRILESWKLDAQRMAESTAENMSGGEEGDLRAVSKTLVQLNQISPPGTEHARKREHTGGTKGLVFGALIGVGAALVFLLASGGWAPAGAAGWMTPAAVLTEGLLAGALVGGIAAAISYASRV